MIEQEEVHMIEQRITEFLSKTTCPVTRDTVEGATLLMEEMDFNQALIKSAQAGLIEFEFRDGEHDLDHLVIRHVEH